MVEDVRSESQDVLQERKEEAETRVEREGGVEDGMSSQTWGREQLNQRNQEAFTASNNHRPTANLNVDSKTITKRDGGKHGWIERFNVAIEIYRMFEKKRFIWIWTKNENRDIQSFFKIPFLIIRRACDDDLVLLSYLSMKIEREHIQIAIHKHRMLQVATS